MFVVGVPGVLILYVVGIAGVVLLYNYATKSLPISDKEWQVVIDARDLAAWSDGLPIEAQYEQLTKVRFFDFSHEVSYEYDHDAYGVYLNSTLNVEKKASDALATYLPLWAATKAGLSLTAETEITVEEPEGFFAWGDQSRFAILHSNGSPFGNLFIARKGKKVFYLMVAGIYFDSASQWQEFVSPTLQSIEHYSPTD